MTARSMFFRVTGAAALAFAAGCGGELPEEVGVESAAVTAQSSIHGMLKMQNAAPQAQGVINQAASKKLTYWGGPVLKNVNVIPVYWNSAVAFQTNLNAFYSDFVSAGSAMYTSLLPQYSGIGAGTRGTPYVGTKTTGSYTDAQVQAWLTSLINAGNVPAPNANNYYAIHFPSGVSLTASDGSQSCVVWCAYHGTYVLNGVNVNYGIIPDQGGGCAGGCGGNAQRVNNLTSVASHELVEATTDPAVGLATTYAPPLAWYNATYGEIGDICNAQQATVTISGRSYVVQKEFSNSKNACATN